MKKESLKDENLNINIGNLTQGDNYGTQSFEKIEVKKNKTTHKTNPNKKPSIWEIIKSFLSKFWWTIIIPLAIGILLILIEKGKIDIGI